MLELDPGNLSRELRHLEKEGLFLSKKRGNQKCFFLNPAYQHAEELRRTVVGGSVERQDNPDSI